MKKKKKVMKLKDCNDAYSSLDHGPFAVKGKSLTGVTDSINQTPDAAFCLFPGIDV